MKWIFVVVIFVSLLVCHFRCATLTVRYVGAHSFHLISRPLDLALNEREVVYAPDSSTAWMPTRRKLKSIFHRWKEMQCRIWFFMITFTASQAFRPFEWAELILCAAFERVWPTIDRKWNRNTVVVNAFSWPCICPCAWCVDLTAMCHLKYFPFLYSAAFVSINRMFHLLLGNSCLFLFWCVCIDSVRWHALP